MNDYKAKFAELHLLTNSEIMDAPKKTKVYFFSLDKPARLKNTSRIKLSIESIFKQEKQKLDSINYVFCSDKAILKINKEYLNHHFYTDVITFNLSNDNEPISAEVYISLDRVRANAKKLGATIKSELYRVLIHAALHLCDYNDKTKKDIEQMRRREDELLLKYFSS